MSEVTTVFQLSHNVQYYLPYLVSILIDYRREEDGKGQLVMSTSNLDKHLYELRYHSIVYDGHGSAGDVANRRLWSHVKMVCGQFFYLSKADRGISKARVQHSSRLQVRHFASGFRP
jgi:hypothetical protein